MADLNDLTKAYNGIKKDGKAAYDKKIQEIANKMREDTKLKDEIFSSASLYAKIAGDLHKSLGTSKLEQMAYKAKRMKNAMLRGANSINEKINQVADSKVASIVKKAPIKAATALKRKVFSGRGGR